jgi:hypothetical protein
MSPRAVSARLHRISHLLNQRGFVRKGADMSPGAVTLRLRSMASLSDMCARLGKAAIKPGR